jgi:hypothetical protein
MQLQLQQLQAAVATKRLRCEWNSRHKDMIEEAVIEGRPLFFRLDGNLRKPFPLLVYIYTHDLQRFFPFFCNATRITLRTDGGLRHRAEHRGIASRIIRVSWSLVAGH